MSPRLTSRLVWSVLTATGLMLAATVILSDRQAGDIPAVLVVLGVGTVGAVLASRVRRNPIGWILLALAAWWTTSGFVEVWLEATGNARLAQIAEWQSHWTWAPVVLVPVTLILLLFPDGRLPTPRWRPIAWAAILGISGFTLGMAFDQYLGGAEEYGTNPYHVPLLSALAAPSSILLVGALIGSVASVLVRYRRSRGLERQQFRWLAYSAAAAIVTIATVAVVEATAPGTLGPVSDVAILLAIMLIPVSIGIAVLRYRLYDIDLVISKTVVFAGLAGFITAVYVGIVVGVGSLIGAGEEPNLGLSIVATAVVAVAFQPVRERLIRVANRLVYGRRATPYDVLSRFSAQVGETVATEQTLEHMARLLAEGTGAARTQVWLKVGQRMRSAASWPEDAVPDLAPLVNADGSLPEFAEVDLAVPVSHDNQLLGALTVMKKRGEPITTPTERSLVEDLAGQAGLVLRNVGLTAELRQRLEELRDSRRRLVEAQDGERRRLERDLHDGAQQQLVSLKIKLGLARRLAERDGATQASQLLDQLDEETDEAVAALRELAHGIYPPLLAAEGLAGALQARAAKAPVPVTVAADGVGRFSQEVEAAVYCCILEAIQNAAKYAHTLQITRRRRAHAASPATSTTPMLGLQIIMASLRPLESRLWW
ncbi:MAG: histidine kinase [Actinomycetota bacterium]|nr:histidine kinase [Actinomycetota bacterium]